MGTEEFGVAPQAIDRMGREIAGVADGMHTMSGTELPGKGLPGAHQPTHRGRGETEHGAVAHNDDMERGGAPDRDTEQRGIQAVGRDGQEFMTEAATHTPAAEPEMSGHELDSFLGQPFESKPIWTDLYENLRDVFFPKKLPPLELTSKPIPVVDPMAVKTNPWSFGSSAVLQAGLVALLIWLGMKTVPQIIQAHTDATPVDITDFKINMPIKAQQAGGGGGGGSQSLVDPIKGKLPKIEKQPITPPQVPVVEKPKLAEPSAIAVQQDIKLPDNPNMVNIGVKNSPNVTLASNGQGSGAGMGTGHGGGLGSGSGNGYGPGEGGNYGGGIERIGGGVSQPIPVYTVDPEFSEEARRAKYQGEVMVQVIVDAQGNVQNPHIVRPLGMGLDEKALEAVVKYKFKPALKNGKPVAVYLTVAINFRLY
jgi:periplasmic protein TonB